MALQGTILINYFEFGLVFQKMLFRRFLIRSSSSPCVRWSGTIYAILVESIMGKIHVELPSAANYRWCFLG